MSVQYVLLASAIALWYGSSVCVNIAWKAAYKVHPNILVLTCLQFGVSFVIGVAFRLGSGQYANHSNVNVWTYWKSLVLIGVAFALGQLCTNTSLSMVSVGLTHVIKISEPTIAIVGGRVLLDDVISWRSMGYIGLLLIGVVLTAVNDATFNLEGVAYAALSNVFLQSRNILIKYYQRTSGSEEDILLFKGVPLFANTMTIGLAFMTVILVSYCTLVPGSVEIVTESLKDYSTYFVGGCFACQHLLSYYVLSQITVTTHALFNAVKRALIIVISCAVLHSHLSRIQLFGVAMACFFFYKYLNEKASKPKINEPIQRAIIERSADPEG